MLSVLRRIEQFMHDAIKREGRNGEGADFARCRLQSNVTALCFQCAVQLEGHFFFVHDEDGVGMQLVSGETHPDVFEGRSHFCDGCLMTNWNRNASLAGLMGCGDRQVLPNPLVEFRFVEAGRMALIGLHRELELGHLLGDTLGCFWIGLDGKWRPLLQDQKEHSSCGGE